MNSIGIILGEPNSINSEILAKSNAYKKNYNYWSYVMTYLNLNLKL